MKTFVLRDAGSGAGAAELSVITDMFVDDITSEQVAEVRGWANDLRTKYTRQTTGRLAVETPEGTAFCCLGVGEDRLGCEWHSTGEDPAALFLRNDAAPPTGYPEDCYVEVRQSSVMTEKTMIGYGLLQSDGEFRYHLRNEQGYPYQGSESMASLNDAQGWDFKKIGDFLDFALDQHLARLGRDA